MYRTLFLNRESAGKELGRALRSRIEGDAAVLGISGDGMAVAAEVAHCLNAVLYPLAVHKLRIPGHDNLSMGAVAPQGVQWLDRSLIGHLGITEGILRKVVQKGVLELQRVEEMHTNVSNFSLIAGRTAVIIDDGISHNIHNILAAMAFARKWQPRQLLVAAPVISSVATEELEDKCEGLCYLYRPDMFISPDYWYEQQTLVPTGFRIK
jgi:putative phosphoribosyl transferase